MKTNKEIVTEIIENLENTVGLNWPIDKRVKVTRGKLIECFSQNEVADWKYYGYKSSSGVSNVYTRLFSDIKKLSKCTWQNHIFNIYNVKICNTCKLILSIGSFNIKDKYICNKCKKEYNHTYYTENAIKIKEKQKIYSTKNVIEITKYKNTWAKENSDKVKVANAKWKRENKGKVAAMTRKYQASKLNRTPSWLTENDYKEMEMKYIKAKELEKETGIQYHVDHIIPLQGKIVSGLHVPSNLQVITAESNLSKSNNYGV